MHKILILASNSFPGAFKISVAKIDDDFQTNEPYYLFTK